MTEDNTYSKLMSYFDKVNAAIDKFESDLIASGRYKYLKTKDNEKIYIEKYTGQVITVMVLPS